MKGEHMAQMREKSRQVRGELKNLATCDFPNNNIRGRLKLCRWNCGKTTRNISEIGDNCWKDKVCDVRT